MQIGSFVRFGLVMAVSATAYVSMADEAPGGGLTPVTVASNQDGTAAHRFAMPPAITNLATATNDLAMLRQQLVKIDDEIKQVLARQTPLKPVMGQDYRTMATFPADYVPQDDEGKKIKARMTAVETELKDLRAKLQNKMEQDPAYKELKSKVDAHKAEWLAIEKRKDELRQERSEVGGKVWQLQKLTEEAEKAAKAKEQEAGTAKSTP